MSRPVDDRLRELADDVRRLDVLPAAAVRERGRSRGRRRMAALTVAGAVVVTSAGVAVAWPQRSPGPATTAAAPGTSQPAPLSCDLTLPDSPARVQVRVLGTGAATVGDQLRDRTFTVVDGASGAAGETTELRYGPEAIGAATLLRAVLHDDATMRFDPQRTGRVVDLTLGAGFTRLASTTEVNRNLVEAGLPSAPPECR